jgi:RNA recognition motif-containing protein
MDYETQMDEDSSTPAKLFVGQIPKDVTESTLSGYFEEYGAIKEVSIIRDSAGASRGKLIFISYAFINLIQFDLYEGCAFVTYFKQSSAILAVQNLHDKVKLTHVITNKFYFNKNFILRSLEH